MSELEDRLLHCLDVNLNPKEKVIEGYRFIDNMRLGMEG